MANKSNLAVEILVWKFGIFLAVFAYIGITISDLAVTTKTGIICHSLPTPVIFCDLYGRTNFGPQAMKLTAINRKLFYITTVFAGCLRNRVFVVSVV